MTTEEQTVAFVRHHLDSFQALDFPAVLSDYSDNTIFMTPTGTIRVIADL
jgi:ketosteroid isomerase-like protein